MNSALDISYPLAVWEAAPAVAGSSERTMAETSVNTMIPHMEFLDFNKFNIMFALL